MYQKILFKPGLTISFLVYVLVGSTAVSAQSDTDMDDNSGTVDSAIILPSPTPSPTSTPAVPACGEEDLLTLSTGGEVSPNLSMYRAKGANPGGLNGAMNTCHWEARSARTHEESFSDYNPDESVLFGQNQQAQDYSRGVSEGGGHEAGGVYSYFDSVLEKRAILIQPSGRFFTPGYLILRIRYTGEPVDQLRVTFRQYQLNDQERTSLLRLAWAVEDYEDEASYQTVFADQEEKKHDTEAQLESFCESVRLSGVNLMRGDTLYLRWEFNDFKGRGNRDEVGIGSISVTTDLVSKCPEEGSVSQSVSQGTVSQSVSQSRVSRSVSQPTPSMAVINKTNSSTGSNAGAIAGGVIGGVVVVGVLAGAAYGMKKGYDKYQARQKPGTENLGGDTEGAQPIEGGENQYTDYDWNNDNAGDDLDLKPMSH
ncbi:MAG: hypothetical protein ACR2PT_10105 [Endozoicomonas sp.]